jgi:hypothetical protein
MYASSKSNFLAGEGLGPDDRPMEIEPGDLQNRNPVSATRAGV